MRKRADEIGEIFGIVLDAEEIALVLAAARAAIAGAHGIDEYEVGEVEPARIVVDQPGRGALHLTLGRHLDGLGAEGAEMQIGRRRARSAIEHEGDRPLGVARLARIGDIEDRGERLAVGVAHGKRPGGGSIMQALAGEVDGVLGARRRRQEIDSRLFVRLRLLVMGGLDRGAGLGGRLRRGLLGWSRGERGEQNEARGKC